MKSISIVLAVLLSGVVAGWAFVAAAQPADAPLLPPWPAAAATPALGPAPPPLAGARPLDAPPPPLAGVRPRDAVPPPAPGAGVAPPPTVPAPPAGLQRAAATAVDVCRGLALGRVWCRRAPGGELEMEAALLCRGVPVAVLHVDPRDGRVLPLGMVAPTFGGGPGLPDIRSRLAAEVRNLKILPAAEYAAPEASWSFPLALGHTIAARLKVSRDGSRIVPAYAADREMALHGR